MQPNNYKHIDSNDANSTVAVTTKHGVLARITINKTSAHALTVKNGAGGDTIAILKASVAEGHYDFEVSTSLGISVEVPASYVGDATIAYR